MGIRTVMITGDNPLTAAAIAQESGVDDFLAEATPETKMALIKKEQEGGVLVAMTGDGTNDAPALAQADVGVAMNTGTTAAKEAGNMVDLDSNPTKLMDIVEIGKQLLITRGALTTFSIANDVAKYFAIIPAMFVATYPALDRLNVMNLTLAASPRSCRRSSSTRSSSCCWSRSRCAGVRYRPVGADGAAAPQPADLRPRRDHRAVRRHQADRHGPRAGATSQVMRRDRASRPRSPPSSWRCSPACVYPLVMTGVRAGRVRRTRPTARSSSVDGADVGSSLIGQQWDGPRVVLRPALGGRRRRLDVRRVEPRPDVAGSSPDDIARASRGDRRSSKAPYTPGLTAADDPGRPAHGVGERARPGHLGRRPREFQAPRIAAVRGHPARAGAAADRRRTRRAKTLGFLGEPRVNVLELNLALDAAAPSRDHDGEHADEASHGRSSSGRSARGATLPSVADDRATTIRGARDRLAADATQQRGVLERR